MERGSGGITRFVSMAASLRECISDYSERGSAELRDVVQILREI